MSRFIGSYKYAIDEKGRVNLPVKLRQSISKEANNKFIITFGFEKCLSLYPLDEWKVTEEKFGILSDFNPEHRLFLRMFSQDAEEIKLDGQSRLMIPEKHRLHAGLETEVMIIGIQRHLELWNPQIYETYLNSSRTPFEELAARVMGERTS